MDPIILLFILSLVAGLLDTLAGGGGLITLPALMMSGISPIGALATNKLQGSMGTGMASWMMLRKNKVQWETIRVPMLYALIGATVGAGVVQLITTDALDFVIPVVLILNALYFLAAPMPAGGQQISRLSQRQYQQTAIPLIGLYDGMFGPGTGSFFTLSGIVLRGKPMLDATAVAKPLNFATNIASLVVFLFSGKIVWTFGLIMMLGQAIGAWAGSHCLFRINVLYLRLIVVSMCLAMLAKYFDLI